MHQWLLETVEGLRQNDPTLVNLELFDKGIGDAEAQAIAEALRENSTLQKLDLSDNEFEGAEAAASLASLLRNNSSLTKLDLTMCNLGPDAGAALAAALKENTTLTELKFVMQSRTALTHAHPSSSAPRSIALISCLCPTAGPRVRMPPL